MPALIKHIDAIALEIQIVHDQISYHLNIVRKKDLDQISAGMHFCKQCIYWEDSSTIHFWKCRG